MQNTSCQVTKKASKNTIEGWPRLDEDYIARCNPYDAATPLTLMRFRLSYQGPLPPVQRDNKRAAENRPVRRQLNSQLADLYRQEHVLSGKPQFTVWYGGKDDGIPIEQVYSPCSVKGASEEFIPLIRASMEMVCDLDVTMLLNGKQGSVVTKDGDLDNRLKTLFDGLKIPTASDIAHAAGPIEQPFHCLMDDDALITSLTVRTDRFLTGLAK